MDGQSADFPRDPDRQEGVLQQIADRLIEFGHAPWSLYPFLHRRSHPRIRMASSMTNSAAAYT